MVGSIITAVVLVAGLLGPIYTGGGITTTDSETVDLNIYQMFSLENESSVVFDREFSLSEKQDISLIHIKCRSSENTVKRVAVNVTLNGIQTTETFEDSDYDYSSAYTFYLGTTLTVKIDPSTSVYVLLNYLKLEIAVDTRPVFNSEKGDFLVDEVIFESFTPPAITGESESSQLPLRISKGMWYISPLTILKERRLESDIFVTVQEDVNVKFDISITPSTVPFSSTKFTLVTPHSTFENGDSGSTNTIDADLKKGDTLFLIFKFRLSSELSEPLVEITLTPTVTVIPPVEVDGAEEPLTDFALPHVPLTFLEAARVLMIVIPLGVFYIRKSSKKPTRKDNIVTNYDVS